MIVTVYSAKGGAGKTPIAVNLAMEHELAIGTNDPISILSVQEGIPEGRLVEIEPHEEFPDVRGSEGFEVVFDLGGAISKGSAPSILSAVKQSDVVIVPICDDPRSITGGLITLRELRPFNVPLLVVATKLERRRNEPKRIPIEETQSFLDIREAMDGSGFEDVPALPLRFSRAFENVFKTGVSIESMVREGGIQAWSYQDLAAQLEAITNHIKQVIHER